MTEWGTLATTPGDRHLVSVPRQRRGIICRDGAGWAVVVDDHWAMVPDLVGIRYLAELLTHPGEQIAALALAGQGSAPHEQTNHAVLDDTARTAYAARARELSAELAEAESHNDLARKEHLQIELDALVDQVETTAGLGGRPRAFTNSTERARTAVRKAIKRALDVVDQANPVVGGVLRRTVSTGVTCVYQPEVRVPVVWTIGHPDGLSAAQAADEPVATETIGDWLDAENGRHFVGRAPELDLVRTALEASSPPFSVLYVHGSGGVGKTALLGRLAALARAAGRRPVRLDLHTIEATPSAFLAAFAASVGHADGDLSLPMLADRGHLVVLIDAIELAEPLHTWLHHEFVAGLPASTFVVIAGRNPPATEGLLDPSWRALSCVVALDNLSEEESGRYLDLQGVDTRMHPRLWALTRGHPLALSLVVDLLSQRTEQDHDVMDLMDTPDIVRTLMQRFVGEIPDQRHREALAVCAHTRFTTEDLLRVSLGVEDATELFAWLRSRPFVEEGRYGLFPHDLAREVLDTDLRWRDRVAYTELHVRIRGHLVDRVHASSGPLQQQAAADIIYLQRLNPIMRPLFDWAHLGNVRVERLAPSDHDLVVEMTERHQGAAQAELAGHWLDRQPEAFRAFRERDEVVGYAAHLWLHEASEADIEHDPGTHAMWDYAKSHDPPRPSEKVTAIRFAVDRARHQARPSATHEGLSIAHILYTNTLPGLSWDFIAPWLSMDVEPMMNYCDYSRVPEAEFSVDGRHHFVFACDWRQLWWHDFVEATGPLGGSAAAQEDQRTRHVARQLES